MFDITLMSEADHIIAGSSGFAKLASWIGDKPLESPADYFSSKKQTAIIKKDLLNNGNDYPKLQTSFAYWYAYFYGRHNKNLNDSEYLLTQAYKYDPENELYPLILATLFYKSENYERGEEILKSLFSLNNIFEVNNHPACSVICAKTMGKLNISEFIPFLQKASELDYPYATIVMFIVKYDDNTQENKYLLQLGSYKRLDNWASNFYQNQLPGDS